MKNWLLRDREIKEHRRDGTPGGSFVKFEFLLPCASPVPDAAFMRKSKKKHIYGYNHHTGVDADSWMVTSSAVTPGIESDGALMADDLDERTKAFVAYKTYDLPSCRGLLDRDGIESRSIRKRGGNRTRNFKRYVV